MQTNKIKLFATDIIVFQIGRSYLNNGKDKKTFSVTCRNLQFYHRLFFLDNECSLLVEERLPALGCLVLDSELYQTFRLVNVFKVRSCIRNVLKIRVVGTAALPQHREFFVRNYFTIISQ